LRNLEEIDKEVVERGVMKPGMLTLPLPCTAKCKNQLGRWKPISKDGRDY
jgi:hypothetical protein